MSYEPVFSANKESSSVESFLFRFPRGGIRAKGSERTRRLNMWKCSQNVIFHVLGESLVKHYLAIDALCYHLGQ